MKDNPEICQTENKHVSSVGGNIQRFERRMVDIIIPIERPEARLLIIEDYADYIKCLRETCEDEGIRILLVAQNLNDVNRLIEEKHILTMGINIATIDGDLGSGPWEGAYAARKLREAYSNLYLIGMSSNEVADVDINIGKRAGSFALATEIKRYLERLTSDSI